jgi:membrane-associated phospholipid phosphatase
VPSSLRRLLPALFALTLASAAAGGAPAGAAAATPSGNAIVAPWINVTLQTIKSHQTNPPRTARGLGLVSVAIAEAAFQAAPARKRAAVAAAASTVLIYLYPDEAERFRALARTAGAERSAGGRRVGERVVRRARSDGSSAVWTGSVPTGSGMWTPTPPAFAPPLEVLAAGWRPWNVGDVSRFRPAAPPRPGSARFAAELLEVYNVSRSLTAEQRRIAEFWADGAGTVTPPGHWNMIALELMRGRRLSIDRVARIFAVLNTAQADAFIACWDAKFTYWSERPVSAIRRELDPNWLPHITTPPFPAYVSGHSSTSGAASAVLARFFPRAAARLRAQAAEAAVSRLYGGIHFRSDNDAGLRLGRRMAAEALEECRRARCRWT